MKYIAVQDNQLVFAQCPCPVPKAHQCLIKVKAIGVNRADLLQRAGQYPAPAGDSEILGIEASGEIAALGADVQQWQLGDKVFAIVPGGAYAEYVLVNAKHLIKIPKSLDFIQAAGCAETFLTAYQSLFTIGKLTSKDSVLIHAGASGVGSAAIKLAKALGCFVVTTVGSDEKAAVCLSLGADVALNYHQVDFVQWSKEHHKQGFKVIVDVVAGEYLPKNIKVAAMDAQIIILSLLAGRFVKQLDIAQMLRNRVTIHASTLRNRDDEYKTSLINSFLSDFSEALNESKLLPLIDESFHWQDAELAHQKMAKNLNIGKLVLTI